MLRTPRLLVMASLAAVAGAGCGELSTTPLPPPSGSVPLIPGVWYLHEVDDEPLPALVSDRIVGVAQEEVFVDSARLVISANGTFEQRYWIRVLVTQTLDREEVVIDLGTWRTIGAQHEFTSSARDREIIAFTPAYTVLNSIEQFATHLSAGNNTALYRSSPP